MFAASLLSPPKDSLFLSLSNEISFAQFSRKEGDNFNMKIDRRQFLEGLSQSQHTQNRK